MIGEERIPHALMFCGPQGAGKLPLALAFAAHLLCEHPNPEGPCGTCASCQMVRQWAHPDLHFSFPVYKKKPTDNTTSDDYLPQWREQLEQSVYFGIEEWLADIKAENQQIMHYVGESDSLQRKLALKASQGGRRVVLLWLPERMKTEMANKLLKLSEEPDNVLGTIQSRVQRINVPALSESDVAETLMNQFALSEAEAKVAAHVAQGNYTAALARQQASSEEKTFFDLFVQLMRLSYSRQVRELRCANSDSGPRPLPTWGASGRSVCWPTANDSSARTSSTTSTVQRCPSKRPKRASSAHALLPSSMNVT